ncbi:Zn(2)-C6 fungal-type domain-containing protein [Favolaschia claudopus]|uniref:Zn(2)-C6 fungal-type domain-containing protein n=1 Tax=Favolaschia claudopus TaxID=2862362 RepID=A0AAV9Z9J5_9AGAR
MPKGITYPHGRGSYTMHACAVCRAKKAKCDGMKPVCGYCSTSGRENECSWGKEDKPPRRARTEAHFTALKKRVDDLELYVDILEGILAKCVCQDVSSHLQSRPQHPEIQSEGDVGNLDADPVGFNSDDDIIQDLTTPMQRLKLDDGHLLLHGITAPFRFSDKINNRSSRIASPHGGSTLSYVLQLDADDSSNCPEVDWARHLPSEVNLDKKEHDKILHLSFTFFTMWSLRLVPSLFLRDMYTALSIPASDTPPSTLHYSPMLHNALLSLAALYSDDPIIRDYKTREHFANATRSYLSAESQKPSLNLLHSLAFLASFYTDSGNRIEAELLTGMSNSIGITLGLGHDSTAWVKAGLITHEEMMARNWAHWTGFALEVSWALYYGRDFSGPTLNRRKVPIPLVDLEMDQTPWSYAPAKIPPQPNLLTLIFFQSSALYVVASRIIAVINALEGPSAQGINEQIVKLDLELYNWKSGLPSQLDLTPTSRKSSTPQRLVLHLVYWWCFTVLHRPFFQSRAGQGEIDHAKLCTHAAENILELLETWESLYTLRLVPMTIIQIVFSAGTVFLLRALQATSGRRVAHGALNTALAQTEKCVGYLRAIGATWTGAARNGNILQALLDDRLRPIIARRLASREAEVDPSDALSSSSSGPTGDSHPTPPPYAMQTALFTPIGSQDNLTASSGWHQPSSDLLSQMQNLPVGFGAEFLCPMDGLSATAPEVEMTALLPNMHYFCTRDFSRQRRTADDRSVRELFAKDA